MERSSLRQAVGSCALVFVALRALTLVAAVVAGALPSLPPQGVPGWPAPPGYPGWTDLLSAFERFDALWFLRIADGGYRIGDGSAAFFPLYPLAIRFVSSATGGHPYAASLLVSNGAFVAALVVVYRLTEVELGRRVASGTILLLAFFPTAYFFVFPYSESLFLLCAATAFLAARQRRWFLAGLAAAAASLTRGIGIALVPALAIEALQQRREGRGAALPGLAAAAAGALGAVAYPAWWRLEGAGWLLPLIRQREWDRAFSLPWRSLSDAIWIAWDRWGHPAGGYWIFDLAVVVPVLVLGCVAVMRLRPSYGTYVAASLLVPLMFVMPGRPLLSMPRFVLTAFPVVWVLALWTEARPVCVGPRSRSVGSGSRSCAR